MIRGKGYSCRGVVAGLGKLNKPMPGCVGGSLYPICGVDLAKYVGDMGCNSPNTDHQFLGNLGITFAQSNEA